MARHTRPLLAQQQRLRQAINAFVRGQQRTLRLFANISTMSVFLPGELAAWVTAHPAVQINTEERTSMGIISSVLAGVAQAGVVSDTVDSGPLHLDPIADDPLVLVVPPTHPLAGANEVAFAAAIDEPLVALYQISALQQHIEQHAAELGQALDVRVRMSHFEGFCEMVAHGAGEAILPCVIAERYQQRCQFAVIALQDCWARRRLCLYCQDNARLTPAMYRLLAWLRQP